MTIEVPDAAFSHGVIKHDFSHLDPVPAPGILGEVAGKSRQISAFDKILQIIHRRVWKCLQTRRHLKTSEFQRLRKHACRPRAEESRLLHTADDPAVIAPSWITKHAHFLTELDLHELL